MKITLASLAPLLAAVEAFQVSPVGRRSTSLNILAGTDSASERVAKVMASKPEENAAFDKLVKSNFPGAISNKELESKVASILETKGLTPANTLLCTSLCCDELARSLEDDLNKVYGHNFNLGGLSGFPFAGNTGFGAMSAHVPDDGYCLLVHGPHVGITQDGVIGKVERSGIALVDNCCGSAIAASGYVQGITDGGAKITTKLQQFSDFQQGAVQELILPFGKRLNDADNRMKELPYALYDSQDILVRDIVSTGSGGIKKGLALLSGIQINTSPDTLDYFHPLRFDYYDEDGNVVEDLLPELAK
eukprot:CAMPEP_0172554372 /NCGR_PEP_ID=MMETSP1067-20121228/54238_1 /TAXON_ID=265564 ORGANISM="Thalassiosira punctigera, Strain Tpunct2005C2" /NCGR_SAMPLE_ID=MMETSP1067 /ASSEMBLY_ACC=CAM_ASM_000444 /LENGTH=304 /DNA_ID=CAMNT_0013342727 /DNA_START=68 /DNA_END=982 /DNA_ORIENTATION=-